MSKTKKNLALAIFFSCIATAAIDQLFMGYGYRICEVTWQSPEAHGLCDQKVKKESKEGFVPNIAVGALIAFAGLSIITKGEE